MEYYIVRHTNHPHNRPHFPQISEHTGTEAAISPTAPERPTGKRGVKANDAEEEEEEPETRPSRARRKRGRSVMVDSSNSEGEKEKEEEDEEEEQEDDERQSERIEEEEEKEEEDEEEEEEQAKGEGELGAVAVDAQPNTAGLETDAVSVQAATEPEAAKVTPEDKQQQMLRRLQEDLKRCAFHRTHV